MKKNILTLFCILIGLSTQAQIPSGYYNNAIGKRGDELKEALHDIINNHTSISYQQIWNAFWSTDNKGNGVVWDMYSDIPNGTPPYTYQMGQNQCGSYNQEGDCYNREHSWPQSWFGDQNTPRTDLHHIFPTDGYVNQQRGNNPYGEVKSGATTFQNGSKLGNCKSTLGYTGTVFEPIDEYKGDFARALMYMSVRYYGEDSSWGSSGMTNKSVIEPWAIQMLMRWNEQDPVSAKEIARNNVIYNDYQHNRNPFIDHPEYARAIWDPNWTSTEYNITYTTVQHGSISGPTTATQGSTVTITATPAEGYMIGSWSVYKTGDTGTTVSVNSDGSFTMPGFNVTVSASFVQNSTFYSITCASVQHGSISTSVNSARSGSSITLTASPATGYSLYSWYVYKTGDMNTMVYHGTSNTFTMPAFDVTVMATFVQPASYNYVKVTSAPTDWSGEYLIVCESQSVAFNGTIDNNWGRCSNVAITSNTIASTTITDAYIVTINKNGSSYKFKLPSGQYMSWTSKEFKQSPTGNSYSINLDNSGNVSIVYGDYTLKYNHNSGNGGLRSYTSGQTAIQLYKKTGSATTSTHTIHFNSNGGSGTMGDQTVNEYEPTQLNTNEFQRSSYVFMGWNTQADGMGQYYTDGATVSLLDDLTLYAQWKQIFTITLATIQNGSVTVSQNQALEGDLISLTATPSATFEFDHWAVTDASENPIVVTDNQFEMPASNVTVNVVFVYVGAPFVQKYHLVTSTDQLVAGRSYLIVNTSAQKALGTTQNGNNRSAVGVNINSNIISSIGSDVCELTLGGQSGAWTFFDSKYNNNAGGYLYAAGGTGNNYLRTQPTLTDEGKWTITFDNSNNATIKTIVTTVGRHTIMYNNGSTIFSCYASGQQPVQLFILSEEYNHTESETIANLFPFDKHTVSSGTILTVSGIATCDHVDNLIIDEGGQFFHHNDGVKATIKKSVDAYTNNSGWYTIATPFTSLNPSAIAKGSYDLYAYGEDVSKEWINYKAHASDFPTTASAGYLYAHHPDTTLRMTGTLLNGDYSETVSLSYGNSNAEIKGFNLLGNPTAHDITFNKSDDVADGYYYLSNSETWVYETGNNVPAGRGFIVKAEADGQTVTLNPQNRDSSTDSHLCISIDNDKVYVKMNEGVSMPLLALNGKSPQLSLAQEGKSYIMLVRNGANRIDLNYQPNPGQHALSANTENLNVDYLHLFDNITGTDVDLLATPSYGFESSHGDIVSRFQLRFSAVTDDSNSE